MLQNNNEIKQTFSQKRPVLAVVIIELLLLLSMMAAGTYATINELSYTTPVLLSFTPIALVLVVYMTLRKRWGYFGFKSLGTIPPSDLKFYAPLAVLLLILATNGFANLTAGKILFFLFFTLLVGFVEETVYRGLILNILRPQSVKAAVIVSSILFSITHLLNALSGQSAFDTALQLVYSLLVGLALALLMIKNGNIVPLIVFHFIHNFIQFTGNERPAGVLDYIVIAVLLAHSVWIIASFKKSNPATNAQSAPQTF